MNLKKNIEIYLRVNLLGSGPRLMKKEFTGPLSDKGRETLSYRKALCLLSLYCVASEITIGFLKLFSSQCSQISGRPL